MGKNTLTHIYYKGYFLKWFKDGTPINMKDLPLKYKGEKR